MDQRQKCKLSSLNDEDIATFLDLLEIDDDTDVEEDLEDLLDEDVDDAELPIDTGIDEVINRAVNLSDSMLESEVCVNLNGSPASFAHVLSPSTSTSSNIPQSQNRKRKAPGEQVVGQRIETIITDPGEFVGSVNDIDPKSQTFKKMLWRKKNLVLDKSAIGFSEPDLGDDIKSLDTPFKCFEYFLGDSVIDHIVEQTISIALKRILALPFQQPTRKYENILVFYFICPCFATQTSVHTGVNMRSK